jgi:hypothetical protein
MNMCAIIFIIHRQKNSVKERFKYGANNLIKLSYEFDWAVPNYIGPQPLPSQSFLLNLFLLHPIIPQRVRQA